MAYLGNDLQVAFQSYQIIDDISSSFNGVLTTFALQVGGVTPVPFPINPQQCLISVNGVIQEPDPTGASGFNLVGSNIEFSSAPTGGHSFFGVILAGADYVNVGVNYPSGSESAPSITFDTDLDTGIYNPAANELGFVTNGNDAIRINSSGDVTLSADLTVDTNTLYVDSSNNRVGIGTTSVSSLLTVKSPGAANTFIDALNSGNTSILSLTQSAGGSGQFKVGDSAGTTFFTVDAAGGQVLVGTSTADGMLHVKGAGTHGSLILEAGGTSGSTNLIYLQGHNNAGTAIGEIAFDETATNQGAIVFKTNGGSLTERMRITSNAYVRLASGTGGIQFNGDTAAANALDDYEEGTFTPTFTNAGTATYTLQVGNYVKIGNVVTATVFLQFASQGSASGPVAIDGFPFITKNTANLYAVSSSVHGTGWAVTRNSLNLLIPPGQTTTNVIYYNMASQGATYGLVQHSDLGLGNTVVSFTYISE